MMTRSRKTGRAKSAKSSHTGGEEVAIAFPMDAVQFVAEGADEGRMLCRGIPVTMNRPGQPVAHTHIVSVLMSLAAVDALRFLVETARNVDPGDKRLAEIDDAVTVLEHAAHRGRAALADMDPRHVQ